MSTSCAGGPARATGGGGGGVGDAHGHGRHAKEQQQSNHVALVDRPRVKLVFSKDLVLLRGGGGAQGGQRVRGRGVGVRRGAEGQCGRSGCKEASGPLRCSTPPCQPPLTSTQLFLYAFMCAYLALQAEEGKGCRVGGALGQCQSVERRQTCRAWRALTHLAHRRGAPEAMLVEGARAPAAARRCVAAESVRQDAISFTSCAPHEKTNLFFWSCARQPCITQPSAAWLLPLSTLLCSWLPGHVQ